jgi:hypothetical protein
MATIKPNYRGRGEVLNSKETARAVEALAEQVAGNVRDQGITVGDVDGGSHEIDLPVDVTAYDTDRARASVIIKHPAGLAVQAKRGALTKAASEAGLEVNG